jgi:hypothetical protein
MAKALIVALLLAAAVACSDDSSSTTTPSPTPTVTNVAGTWTGAISVTGQTARMTWTLSQANTSVTGPVLINLTNGTVLLNGFLNGTITGNSLAYTISVGPGGIPTQPTCVGQMTGTMNATIGATSMLTGPMTVSSSTCVVPITNATMTLTRS